MRYNKSNTMDKSEQPVVSHFRSKGEVFSSLIIVQYGKYGRNREIFERFLENKIELIPMFQLI